MARFLVVMLVALWSFLAYAEEQSASAPEQKSASSSKEQGSGPNPYTECGIGAAIFKDTGWAAATSNVIWDLGLTAITSALSSPQTCNAKKVKTAKLILETLPQMEKDIAMGQGRYLDALAETMDCPAGTRPSINSNIRAAYSEVVSRAGYSTETRIERATGLFGSVRAVTLANPTACNVNL